MVEIRDHIYYCVRCFVKIIKQKFRKIVLYFDSSRRIT